MSADLEKTTLNDLVTRVGRLESDNENISKGFQSLVDQMGGVSFGLGSVLNTILKLAIKNGWVESEEEIEKLVMQEQKEMLKKQPNPQPGVNDGGDQEDKTSEGHGTENENGEVQDKQSEGKEQETETGETSSETA